MMTAAAIDRLVHHSVIVELNIPSYRLEAKKKQQEPEGRQLGGRAMSTSSQAAGKAGSTVGIPTN
jgi:hypothetical protein